MLKERYKIIARNLEYDKVEEGYDSIEKLIKRIVEESANEECIVYSDKIDKENKVVEVHFADCNYYEINVNINDKAEDVIRKVFIYLIEERDKDKMNPNINGNNQRYYMKHNI
ncbi:hypothetical protein [Clostridium saudiense]|uniref:hypothetical protein n=1 Tax=Clostridium TaxID=1485 RepID=UPI0026706486|nr:hypothetical protein [Clostridium saudiense]